MLFNTTRKALNCFRFVEHLGVEQLLLFAVRRQWCFVGERFKRFKWATDEKLLLNQNDRQD